MNTTDLKRLPDHLTAGLSSLTFAAVSEYFAGNACARTINLSNLGEDDETCLARIGISLKHLSGNLKETLSGRYFDPLAFQLSAVQSKAMDALCPFRGTPVKSSHSLLANINILFYRFETEEVFYVVAAGIGSGFTKSALYFPEHELVVTAGDPWGLQQDDLTELKARMVTSAAECCDYLLDASREDRKVAVCLGFYHFAHHFWNELSGIHRLHRRGLLPAVNKFLVLREPLGPLEQIFPEIPADRIERNGSTNDLFHEILKNRYFAVRAGDNYLAKDLALRVAKVSAANCLSETLELVKEARGKHYPLLWVGIRIGNRSWADQVDGLSSMIETLHKEFPKLGVVFDGFSLPADRAESGDEQGFSEILAPEYEVVERIVEKLQARQVGVGIYNIIGRYIFDANVWAHAIDVYVSPYGSLQHKVGWFANKPGIIHTNQTLLQSPAKYVWAAVENGIPPRYVGADYVTGIPSESNEWIGYNQIKDASESGAGIHAANERARANPEFDNYSVNPEGLCREIVDLVRSPKRRHALAAPVLANRAKRTLRTAVRALVAVVITFLPDWLS